MHGIAIFYVQHCYAMFKRGVCELALSFFHYINLHLNNYMYYTTVTLHCQVHLHLLYIRFYISFIFTLHLPFITLH